LVAGLYVVKVPPLAAVHLPPIRSSVGDEMVINPPS
jgi:hypothetical protein